MSSIAVRFGVVASGLSADPRQAARLSRELGFDGLQFDVVQAGLDLPRLSGSGRRELVRLLASQEQQLIGLRMDLGAKGFGPGSDIDRLLDRLDRAMDAAAGLSAPLICLDIGPLPVFPRLAPARPRVTPQQAGLILLPLSVREEAPAASPPPPPPPPPDPALVAQVNAALSELGRRADRYSIVLAFRSELAPLASLEQILRQVDCPWFGVDLDPVAVLQDAWELDEFFSETGERVRHVRARDALLGSERRTKPMPIGQGSVDWPALLAGLEQADYQGWITVDPLELPDRYAGARIGLARLRAAH